MAWRGTDNLRFYLGKAVLPQMPLGVGAPEIPPEGHKSHHNTLTVCPEPYRKLQSIYQLQDRHFDNLVLDWIEDYIPFESFGVDDEDEMTGERLSVPAGVYCNIPPMPLNRPSEISRVSVWVDQLPLETVQRTIHLVFPETQNWRFVHNEVADIDKEIFKHIEWKDSSQSQSTRFVVVIQPPWILSSQDMQSFQACQLFPTTRMKTHALDSKHRLWGKIWDLCLRQNCPWFALSTYNGWVFGAFSQGWTTAFVTPILEWNYQLPTVLQSLTYWMASAMDLPGAWAIPEVRETIKNLTPNLSIPPPKEDRISNVPSESSWVGTEGVRVIPSSAGFTASPRLSEAGLPRLSPLSPDLPTLQFVDIQQWADAATQGSSEMRPSFVHPPSPTSTVWSELTADAGDSEANLVVNSAYHGDWMSLPVRKRADMFKQHESYNVTMSLRC